LSVNELNRSEDSHKSHLLYSKKVRKWMITALLTANPLIVCLLLKRSNSFSITTRVLLCSHPDLFHLLQPKLDFLTFIERCITISFNIRVVYKHIISTISITKYRELPFKFFYSKGSTRKGSFRIVIWILCRHGCIERRLPSAKPSQKLFCFFRISFGKIILFTHIIFEIV